MAPLVASSANDQQPRLPQYYGTSPVCVCVCYAACFPNMHVIFTVALLLCINVHLLLSCFQPARNHFDTCRRRGRSDFVCLHVQPTKPKPDGMDLNHWASGGSWNPYGRPAKKCKVEPRKRPLCLGFLVLNAIKAGEVKQYQMFVQPTDTTPGVWKNLVQIFYKHPGSRDSGDGVITYMGMNDATIIPSGMVGKCKLETVKTLLRTIMAEANLVTDQTQNHPVKLKCVNFMITIIADSEGNDWLTPS